MGMFDTVVVLDDERGLSCAKGHALRSFQTKDLSEPSMSTYLVRGGRLFLAVSYDDEIDDAEETEEWRIEGDVAIRAHRFHLREVPALRTVTIYGQCYACDPVLVRTDHASFLGDIVNEHAVFVDFSLTFRSGEPVQVQRTSGTRDDLMDDLRARGVYVLRDEEPLAIAHHEVKKARKTGEQRGSRRRF